MTLNLEKLRQCAMQVAGAENCLLYDIEMKGSGAGRVLRVFIDKQGKGDVSIDDCSQVSKALNSILDVEDLVPGGSYHLEVSSPGLDRHLREIWHFQKAVGKKIKVRLKQDLEGADSELAGGNREPASELINAKTKTLIGSLLKAGDSWVEIGFEEDGSRSSLKIPYQCMEKARVIFCHPQNFNKKKPKKRKG